jgi:hypothetical protein
MRVDLRLAGIAELQREMAKLATPWRPAFGRNAVMAGPRAVAAKARAFFL